MFTCSKLVAQPFSSVDIGISTSKVNILDESYASRWNLTSAKSFNFRTPFYIGTAGLNIDLFDYESKSDQVSDFSSINFSSYLGFRIFDHKDISIVSGLFVGIQKTDTEDDQFDFNAEERELYFSFSVEPQLRIGNFILFGDIQHRKVFNYYRQNMWFLGAGIKFHIKLPKNIQSFIE
ncbi:MAG: hypothetical protein RIE52_02565 [Balneola sp.]